jgi:hypothetical protein
MVDADIRGKLHRDGNNAHSRSEDLLTSTVFGLLRYFSASDGIIPLMERARRASISDKGLMVEQVETASERWLAVHQAVTCEVDFWPSFGDEGQPDVLLTFRDAAMAPTHLVVVEAKLHSPKSGGLDAEENDEEAEADSEEETESPDQLARYWRGVVRRAEQVRAECSLLYLTAHSVPPIQELADSLRACPGMRLGWLSWRDVWRVVRPLVQRTDRSLAAVDLDRLLVHRGFGALDAFGMTAPEIAARAHFWRPVAWFRNGKMPNYSAKGHFWETK